MKIAEVAKLSPTDKFLYWIKERHQIYLKRRMGKPKPWTDDEILQSNFFTCPYRENDKTTQWFREQIRDPYQHDIEVLLATVIFRWFNYIPTGELLIEHNLLTQWDKDLALSVLGHVRNMGGKVFTGAFMINSPGGEKKLDAICRRITNVWNDREALYKAARSWNTLQEAHRALSKYEGLGGFMAYEIVCDLRYTDVLKDATDVSTWCNPGPGAIRGLYRIMGWDFPKGNNASSPPIPKDCLGIIIGLLGTVRRKLKNMPTFEMREVEHSLCEWDKYERARLNDGRMKRKYNGA